MVKEPDNINESGSVKRVKGSTALTAERLQDIKMASSAHQWLLRYLRANWAEIWRGQSEKIRYVVARYVGGNNGTPKAELSFFESKKQAMKKLAGNRFATLRYRFTDEMELMI